MAVLLVLWGCGSGADRVLMDFEGDDFGEWEVAGEAFGGGPAGGTLDNQAEVTGIRGRGFANSFHGGDESRGTLISPEFEIDQAFINFLVGGATREEEVGISLIVNGVAVRTAGARSSRYLSWSHWDVSDLQGQTARIRIMDESPDRRGHVMVDHIMLSRRAYLRPDIERRLTVKSAYLHLPVKTGVEKRRMRIEAEGVRVDDFDIELAEGEPDFWAFVDMSGYIGKPAVLRVTQPWGSDARVLDRVVQSDELMDSEILYREKYRPQFHFTSRRGWNNDPNGLVFYDGEYHMFYQHNPYGWNWGNMHWGHAVSPDLVHWKDLGDAIFPDELGTIFSGSAVVDHDNSAGFQTGEEKAIVCFYTSAGSADAVREVPYTQSISSSIDRGRTLVKYAGNPVIGHIVDANRDPKVIRHEPSGRWVMALYLTRNDYTLLVSENLKQWERIGDITIPGCSECPDIFELPVDGDPSDTRWVFWGANGSYVLGEFDGTGFRPVGEAIRLYAGGTAYAAQTFSDIPAADGRRIQICWLRCAMPGMPFNQQMGFPVELTLRRTAAGIRMFSTPVREIESLYGKKFKRDSLRVEPGSGKDVLDEPTGDLFDIRVEFAVGKAGEIGFDIRGIPVVYDAARRILMCGDRSAPLRPQEGRIRLRILVDRASIEIFGNDGRLYMPVGVIPPGRENPLELVVRGAPARIRSLVVHELESSWR